MKATLPAKAAAVSPRGRRHGRRTWPALFTLLTLACVTPPAPAVASQPPAALPNAPPAQTAPPPETPAPAPAPTPPAETAPSTATTPSTGTTPPPVVQAAPASASAESSCDPNWGNDRASIIVLSQRPDDGKPLEPFRPSDPMYPYELRAGRYLFGEKGTVITAVGRFEDRKEAEAALKQVEVERPSARAVITSMGPYLLPEKPTCKVTRLARGKNPTIDAASWILEKEGVLLAGSQTPCSNGKLTKKVTVMSCDGMKNLFTDSVEEVCDRTRRVDTCVYSMEPGVIMLEHEYTIEGATSFYVRAHDVRAKKRLFHMEASYGSGLPGFDPKTDPETRLEDIDQDGVPEIVSILRETGERISVRKWRQRRFVETRSP